MADNLPPTIGIDVGTSTVSVAAWDARRARLDRVVTAPNDAAVAAGDGRYEQDPLRIWRRVAEAVSEVAGRSPVAAVACTGQMHGILVVDDAFEPLSHLLTWQDRRGADVAAEVGTLLEARSPGGWRSRGCRLHPGYGGVSAAWLLRAGAFPQRGRRLCSVSDWIAARLCGALATDPSMAASWGLWSLDRRSWDAEALAALGIAADLLPPVREPGSRLGLSVAGAPCGAGVPVVVGIGDNQASVLAALGAATTDGSCVVNVGTGSQVSVVSASAPLPVDARDPALELRPFIGDLRLTVGASLSGGAAYALLRRFLGEVRGREEAEEELYGIMGRWAAAAPPGCDGLVCAPAFFGERGREELAGSLTGLTPATLTPANLCRAVLEGMARTLHGMYAAAGVRARRLVGSGNAVRRNPVLREVLAAAFGMPLEVSELAEEAAVGAGMVAALVSR